MPQKFVNPTLCTWIRILTLYGETAQTDAGNGTAWSERLYVVPNGVEVISAIRVTIVEHAGGQRDLTDVHDGVLTVSTPSLAVQSICSSSKASCRLHRTLNLSSYKYLERRTHLSRKCIICHLFKPWADREDM